MHKTITPAAMRAMETRCIEREGVPGLLLMEHAALAVVRQLDALLGKRGAHVLFACGPGNNGGDGLAAARLWALAGGRASVVRLDGRLRGDAAVNEAYTRHVAPVRVFAGGGDRLPDCDAVVDAVFGTGLARAPEGAAAALIEAVNAAGRPVVAVDIPSGMDGGTGAVYGACVRADVTVAFHRVKLGLYLTARPELVGAIVRAPIGIPDALDDAPGLPVLEESDLASLPPRAKNANKGDHGRVLILAGSPGMAGAACVCANAAMRAGAGLTTVACPKEIFPIMQTAAPCAMCVPREAAESARAGVIAAGPGLTQDDALWPLLRALHGRRARMVWDADALNLLARHPMPLGGQCVITPHPGEAARLLDAAAGEITRDPLAAARALSERYACTVVLKGAVSVICEGERLALNTVGSPGMAKGGSGDALTGIVAALLHELAPFDAARYACLLHGAAGRRAAARRGERAMLATDLVDALGEAGTPAPGNPPLSRALCKAT